MFKKTMLTGVLITCFMFLFSYDAAAQKRRRSATHHSSGHYSAGKGSSHKGGHYKNTSTSNRYRKRKH